MLTKVLLLLVSTTAFAEEAAPGFTLSEMWEHAGGIARGVIITLVFMMLVTLWVTIERFLAFRSARAQSMALAASVVGPLKNNDIDAALKVAKSEDYKASYLGGLLRAGLGEMALRQDHTGVENAERAITKAAAEEIAKIKRGMPILATVGSTAPFVGLLGTTFGVINAFQGMASAGAGLAAISAGISEALITTGVGIGVAVIGVWFFNYFNHRIEKVSEEIASSEADILDWANKLVQASDGASAK
jgi:biopolymer transport protein ExbB/TolQ